MPQIFLFTGENAFQLRAEKLRWIGEFSRKYGPENVSRLEAAGLKLRELLDEVAVAPFIAPRRLIVLDAIPRLSKEEMDILEREIHPQTLLLFVDAKPDKRLAGVKQLLAIAEVKTFAPVTGKPLAEWMKAFTANLGSAIEPAAAALLLEYAGEEQDVLAEELRKLSLLAHPGSIKRDHVECMAVPSFEGIVWRLTDLLGAGRRTEAILFAHRYLERGGDAYGLWAILLNMLRNLTGINAAVSAGSGDAKAIADDLGIHFFAVKSLLPYARRIRASQLRDFLDETAAADIALKTGTLRATDEAPEELLALIDRFLMNVPG